MSNIPKISVLIICYKQEELIRRALDSIIAQREFVYEICVSDDCSPDNTWEVLKDYDRRYPGLFKLHRNNPNVGIFQNIEYTWTMPTGNMIYQLSGDDAIPNNYFKSIIEFINVNKIDYSKAVCIYTDYLEVMPSGSIVYHSNKKIFAADPLKLKIRQIISNRGCCYSKALLSKFKKVSQGKSYEVELAQDCQIQIFTDTIYYLPIPGNTYYTQIGVSTRMTNTERQQSAIDSFPFAGRFFETCGYKLDILDKNFLQFVENFERYRLYKRKLDFLRTIFYYLTSIDIRLGLDGFQIVKFLRMVRRLFTK